jgi:hypothetical protein
VSVKGRVYHVLQYPLHLHVYSHLGNVLETRDKAVNDHVHYFVVSACKFSLLEYASLLELAKATFPGKARPCGDDDDDNDDDTCFHSGLTRGTITALLR